jgi:hypothetical protein
MDLLKKEKEINELFDKSKKMRKTIKSAEKVIENINLIDKASLLLQKHYIFDANQYRQLGREDILISMCKEEKVSIDYVKKVMNGSRN